MIPAIRERYNASFTSERYQTYLDYMNAEFNYDIEFRIAETPVFVPQYLKRKLLKACDDIINVLKQPDFKDKTKKAVPAQCHVPAETPHTNFLAIDFAICADENNEYEPQLIELQGFPSLFCFQEFISQAAKKYLDIPTGFEYLFNGLTTETYLAALKSVFCGSHPVENTILLEIEPEKQKTKIDFYCTERYLGIKSVCLTDITKEGRELFYMRDGVKTHIKRIYNRIIFDELEKRTDLNFAWTLTDPVDVEWAGHPNWFFKISKYTLPFLKSKYVPETRFLDDIDEYPSDLENYVLKPLFSFAGMGVKINVTKEDLDDIEDRHNYILMKKVIYAPCIKSPEEPVKTEIRMLFIWPDEAPNPMLVTTLVRLSKGEMVGVRYNQDKTWVGGSMAFFETDEAQY